MSSKLDKAVWAACPAIKEWTHGPRGWTGERRISHTCDNCPHTKLDRRHGAVQQACRGIAEEIVIPVLEALEESK